MSVIHDPRYLADEPGHKYDCHATDEWDQVVLETIHKAPPIAIPMARVTAKIAKPTAM